MARTTFQDATLFDKPYATEFNATGTPNFPVINGVTNTNGSTTYYAHEVGTDEVLSDGSVIPILSFIESGDFGLNLQDSEAQFFMSIKRFLPDFKRLVGDAQITLLLKSFSVDNETSSPLGPFTINSSTQKVDTRARARYASLKVANTAASQSWRYGTFKADVQPDGQR